MTTTNEAAVRIRSAFRELANRPVVSIPLGYAEQDFAGPRASAFRWSLSHRPHGYADTLTIGREQRQTTRRLLRGGMNGVDIMTRSHIYLLEAVERLITSDSRLAARIEVHLAGVLSEGDLEIARRSRVAHLHGYLPHSGRSRLIRTADSSFPPDAKPTARATVRDCTGKDLRVSRRWATDSGCCPRR